MDMLQQLRDRARSDSEKWFPEFANDLTYHALGLSSAAGDFNNFVQKFLRYDIDIQAAVPELRDQLARVFVYFLTLSSVLDMDIMAEYTKVWIENDQKFGRTKGNGKV